MIAILTISKDVHALSVQSKIRAASRSQCHIVECDRIAQRDSLTYGVNYAITDQVLTSEGKFISISDASVIWMRRIRASQELCFAVTDEDAKVIIDNDCLGALTGLFRTHFHGKWISTLEATYRATDKIGQLKAAHECGFRVPKTLVSQSRHAVIDFYQSCAGNVVMKTLAGSPGPFLRTVKLDDPRELSQDAFAASPTIFQEYILGFEHLRLNCFGPRSYAALISSQDLDWRGNLNVPVTSYPVPESLHRRVRHVLDYLGLEMGIVDLKLTPEGEPVWLEVNPQGQFLFLDALTDLSLAEKFAIYLISEVDAC